MTLIFTLHHICPNIGVTITKFSPEGDHDEISVIVLFQ